MLTNIHNHVLSHRYTYCMKEHFQHLALHRPDILSHAVVYDKIDIQNAFITMRMFSCQVEDYFEKQGWIESAKFVQIVRHWHSACSMCGIQADERVHGLYEMHVFLSDQVNFNNFPFTHNHYVNGMPIHTFEVILQNISQHFNIIK